MKIGIFGILICLCLVQAQYQVISSHSHSTDTPQSNKEDQTEHLILDREEGGGWTGLYLHHKIQVFESANQSGYFYRVDHHINHSIKYPEHDPEINRRESLLYVWHYANQIFYYYKLANITLVGTQMITWIINFTFTTPSAIDGMTVGISYENGGTRLEYERLESSHMDPTIYVPNLNRFSLYMTVLTDNFSFRIQQDVIWANTSLAVVLSSWNTTVLTYDAGFEQYITDLSVWPQQYLMVPEGDEENSGVYGFSSAGVDISLNKTNNTLAFQNYYLYQLENSDSTILLTEETREWARSEWKLISKEGMIYGESLETYYRFNPNDTISITFDFIVLQESPPSDMTIYLTAIYVGVAFAGGVGVTLLSRVIRSHYRKRKSSSPGTLSDQAVQEHN